MRERWRLCGAYVRGVRALSNSYPLCAHILASIGMIQSGMERRMTCAPTWDAEQRIREWLLAILRFAVTLSDSDRAAVLAAAADLDGWRPYVSAPAFDYFRRTSAELCEAIGTANAALAH